MYVGFRDLLFAKGRFLLFTAVVTLMTVLVGFLSGLTAGLANQNIAGLLNLGASQFVFSTPSTGSAAFATSALTQKEVSQWMNAAGPNANAVELGVSQLQASNADTTGAVAVFGADDALAGGYSGSIPDHSGEVVLSSGAAKALNASVGDEITVAGKTLAVSAITGDDWYAHTAVIHVRLADWQAIQQSIGGNSDTVATVLAVSGSPASAAASISGTTTQDLLGSLLATPSFRGEIGSLLMIVAMLFGITALVTGAFFTVWTIQRKSDIAVLRALGTPARALVRDTVGQALVILAFGVGVGIAVVAILGAFIQGTLPFVISPLTTLLPAALMIVLGLIGTGLALRTVTTADPLTALGATN